MTGKRPYRKRTTRRDTLWKRKIRRRQKNRDWHAAQLMTMLDLGNIRLLAEQPNNGEVVKISQCFGEKFLLTEDYFINNEGKTERAVAYLNPGQKVLLHNVSAALARKKGHKEAVVEMENEFIQFFFPKTEQTLSIQEMPLHCHMTLVENFSADIHTPQQTPSNIQIPRSETNKDAPG